MLFTWQHPGKDAGDGEWGVQNHPTFVMFLGATEEVRSVRAQLNMHKAGLLPWESWSTVYLDVLYINEI